MIHVDCLDLLGVYCLSWIVINGLGRLGRLTSSLPLPQTSLRLWAVVV